MGTQVRTAARPEHLAGPQTSIAQAVDALLGAAPASGGPDAAWHELRSSVTVLRSYITMLERGQLGDLTEPGRRAAAAMGCRACRLGQLVERLLEAASLERGALELRRETADLRLVVQGSVEVMGPLLDRAHPLDLVLPLEPVSVQVDVNRVQTIVGNLLENAVRYSPGGGTVRCAVSAGHGWASVRVQDHGLGIAAEDVDGLFSRGGRSGSRTVQELAGAGLGLHLARELARLHGGDLTASPGAAGSTFTLRLPQAPVAD